MAPKNANTDLPLLGFFHGLPSTGYEQLEDMKKDAHQTTTHHLSNKSTNYSTKQITRYIIFHRTHTLQSAERQRQKNEEYLDG